MGASGVNLRIDKEPFGGKKGLYSVKPVDDSYEEQVMPKYKEYVPMDTTTDSAVNDFPNKLNSNK